ncbi:MAG: hypothetical protein A2Y94_10925 [Caldithrix sp. RBG_13_44_9]|nr:MAG: hypothetical protein A2Y94_10925 [Caldithrix sp. RBG_13_44_9]
MILSSILILTIISIIISISLWKKERMKRMRDFIKIKSLVNYNLWSATLLIMQLKLRKIF